MLSSASPTPPEFLNSCRALARRRVEEVRAAFPGIRVSVLVTHPGQSMLSLQGFALWGICDASGEPADCFRHFVPKAVMDTVAGSPNHAQHIAFAPTWYERALARLSGRNMPRPFLIIIMPAWRYAAMADFQRTLNHEMAHAVDTHRSMPNYLVYERTTAIKDTARMTELLRSWQKAKELRADLFSLLCDLHHCRDLPYVVDQVFDSLATVRCRQERHHVTGGKEEDSFLYPIHRCRQAVDEALALLPTEPSLAETFEVLDRIFPLPALPGPTRTAWGHLPWRARPEAPPGAVAETTP